MKKPKIILYKKFKDKRGYFSEIFRKDKFKNFFIQDNLVFNKKKNTFRGLHYQIKPFDQGKLITVLQGSIVDYVVKINNGFQKYGTIKKFFLTDKDSKWLWIPPNFAHGYLTCENNTIILYKVTKLYSRAHEKQVNIFKEGMNLKMKIIKSKVIVSKKDS
jgi:dTDP-4-dehydrorhamnose 3,5-epimerase